MSASSESSLQYPGWRVVLAAHIATMVSFGSVIVYTFGIFLKPLAAEFNWSREDISKAFAIAAMALAVSSPGLGHALDRMDPKRVVVPCFAIFAGAIFMLSQLRGELWQLYVTFLVIGIVGNATTQMGFSGAISSWFRERRGLALACVLAGVGIGSMVLPVLTNWSIAQYGWRVAYVILSVLVVVLGIPGTVLFLKRKPRETGEPEEIRGTASDALQTREFWILVVVLFLTSISVNGLLTHLPAHLTDRGMTAASAALVMGVLGGANLLGRLTTGTLLDRMFGPRLSMYLLVAMSGGVLLMMVARSVPEAVIAAVLIGVGLGGEADVTPYLLSRYFGLGSFSMLYGLTWTFYAVAGAVGPVVFGRVFDASGSYTAVMQVAVGLTLTSAVLVLGMRKYPQ